MSISTFIRGSTVFFDVVFKDENGAAVNPGSATITIDFPKKDGSGRDNVALTLAQGAGFATGWGTAAGWDSRVAASGAVYVHARTGGNPPISSIDFEFKLAANVANNDANG